MTSGHDCLKYGAQIDPKHNLYPKYQHHYYKIPLWIGNEKKLVSGIRKTTTCQDVIQSLMSNSKEPVEFVIVEKWKKMERRLDPNARILSIWKAWGDQKDDVSFILKEFQHTSDILDGNASIVDGYIDKKCSNKASRKKGSKTSSSFHINNDGSLQMTESMGKLLKLVLTQGETIQAQLKKLRHQEEQIERYEDHMHRLRSMETSQSLENYVVDSYLRDETGGRKNSSTRKRSKSTKKVIPSDTAERNVDAAESSKVPLENSVSDSKIQEQTLSSEDPDLTEENDLMERICELNNKLTKEEERLVKLGMKIKKIYDKQSDPLADSSTSTVPQNPFKAPEPTETTQILIDLNILREITSEQTKEIEKNEESLSQLEQILDSKFDQVNHLTYEIQLLDAESEQLYERLSTYNQNFTCDETTEKLSLLGIGIESDMSLGLKHKTESMPTVNFGSQNPVEDTPSLSQYNSDKTELPYDVPCCSTSGIHNSNKTDQHDNDSNSDTGISSLHSSGDENSFPGLYMLDTLV